MDAEPLIQRILDDEGLTSDLLEAEAERLNAWLIARAEKLARASKTITDAARALDLVCKKARGAGKALAAWLEHGDPTTVAKLAGLHWQPGNSEAEILAGLLAQID